jgi:hypothetical protein
MFAVGRTLKRFRAVYVLDVSQTEGKELATLTDVEGEVAGYRERLIEYVESQNIKLRCSERSHPQKACPLAAESPCSPECSQPRSSPPSCMKWRMRCCTAVNALTTKQVRETEAEAVAFVVCESVGLQTGTASADYIQLWNGDAKLLAESLKVVQRTAAVILGAISPRTAEEAETAEQAQAAPVCSIQLPIADEAVSGVSF